VLAPLRVSPTYSVAPGSPANGAITITFDRNWHWAAGRVRSKPRSKAHGDLTCWRHSGNIFVKSSGSCWSSGVTIDPADRGKMTLS
jgi:hypothetical protein